MLGNKGHLTAITRTKLSTPMKYLFTNLLDRKVITDNQKQILDFGCGKGFDAESLGLDMYDPYYYPEYPNKKYDIITCNYVLNVLTEPEVNKVLGEIKGLLNNKGVAYITVRRDVKKDGWTKRGTYQRNVILTLPILKETSGYCIYKLEA